MSIVHMNGINFSPQTTPIPYPQPSTHTYKLIHISLSETGRNTTSLFHLDRIKRRYSDQLSRLTFYGKYCLHTKHVLSNYFVCYVSNFHFYHLQSQQTYPVCATRYQGNPKTRPQTFYFLFRSSDVRVHDQLIFC